MLKNRIRQKKGFTLIEIIVVLVIIAILAGAGIPAMMGFINDSRGKALIAEARMGYIAAQTVATEISGGNPALIEGFMGGSGDARYQFRNRAASGDLPNRPAQTRWEELMNNDDLTGTNDKFYIGFDFSTGRVSWLVYEANNMYVIIRPNSSAIVQDTKPNFANLP